MNETHIEVDFKTLGYVAIGLKYESSYYWNKNSILYKLEPVTWEMLRW